MEPIISPWFFYWIGIVDTLRFAMIFIFVHIALISGSIGFLQVARSLWGEEVSLKLLKKTLLPTVLSLFFIVVSIFIPTKTTLIQMEIARNATPNNIKSIIEFSGEIKDVAKEDIVDIIREVKGSK